MAGPTPTYSSVVAHTAAFLAELIADPLLRRHLLSAAAAAGGGGRQQQHPAATLQALSLVSDALDTAASAPPSLSSLRAAERLLLSLAAATPLSCLLLALASASRRRGGAAAAAAAAAASRRGEDGSVETAAMSAMRVLSLMSGAQAQEMRELEREYEKVLNANCTAYALYLKKILEAGDAAKETYSPPPPPPELGSGKGRRELMRPPSLYPQRVPPHLIVQQQPSPSPSPTGRGSPVARLRAEHSPATPSSDVSMEDSPSSSELLAGREEKHTASPLSQPGRARPRGEEDDDDDVAAMLSPEHASARLQSNTVPDVTMATPRAAADS
uniref:Uncharacterized protein n=1 Tax=Oryza meridionalis TaxID=40149 RepID=A0A0E0BZG7_9ORYZ